MGEKQWGHCVEISSSGIMASLFYHSGRMVPNERHSRDMSLDSERIRLELPDGRSAEGTWSVSRLTHPERLRRALKAWGWTWLGAVGAVLIPILHFVLVPMLLIAGPVVAYFIYGQDALILDGSSVCPQCSAPFKISSGRYQSSVKDVCGSCRHSVTIRVVEGEK